MAKAKKPPKYSYVLRCVRADMTSHNDFVWPRRGRVECPDWVDNLECGNGLHGWLAGAGDKNTCSYVNEPGAIFMVVRVLTASIRDLGDKVKFPRGTVLATGSAQEMAALIATRAPHPAPIWATAGDRGTATAGDRGTATAGDGGTATAGDSGTATAGDGGTIRITWYDLTAARPRLAVGYIGEAGLLPNVAYVVRNGKLSPK